MTAVLFLDTAKIDLVWWKFVSNLCLTLMRGRWWQARQLSAQECYMLRVEPPGDHHWAVYDRCPRTQSYEAPSHHLPIFPPWSNYKSHLLFPSCLCVGYCAGSWDINTGKISTGRFVWPYDLVRIHDVLKQRARSAGAQYDEQSGGFQDVFV